MLEISRIIIFARDLDTLGAFYGGSLGLSEFPAKERGWREFDSSACRIALHSGGRGEIRTRAPKIVFRCSDVEAARVALNAHGARFGKVKGGGRSGFM
ncbi:MAG: hypothetical protein HOI34_15135 [Rhodospirillaceae bacterium]|nr:hypothetical protein [Rhodospirillaceae bacterium]